MPDGFRTGVESWRELQSRNIIPRFEISDVKKDVTAATFRPCEAEARSPIKTLTTPRGRLYGARPKKCWSPPFRKSALSSQIQNQKSNRGIHP
jgi:hypothetical protein